MNPQPRARTTDPHTSHAAAASVKRRRSAQVRGIIAALLKTYGPMTDEDIAEWYADQDHAPVSSPSGLRTRRSELVTLGEVVDTGERRRLASGRLAIVWGSTKPRRDNLPLSA